MPCRPIRSLRHVIQARRAQGINEGIKLLPTLFTYAMFLFEVASDAIIICLQGETIG
jgi:hypothetical protein